MGCIYLFYFIYKHNYKYAVNFWECLKTFYTKNTKSVNVTESLFNKVM